MQSRLFFFPFFVFLPVAQTFSARQADATAVLVSTKCIQGGIPSRSTPAVIQLQALTLELSATMGREKKRRGNGYSWKEES